MTEDEVKLRERRRAAGIVEVYAGVLRRRTQAVDSVGVRQTMEPMIGLLEDIKHWIMED